MITKNVQILFGLAALLGAGAGFLWSAGNQLGTMLCGIGAVWLACVGAGLWKHWLGLLAASSSALLVSLYCGSDKALFPQKNLQSQQDAIVLKRESSYQVKIHCELCEGFSWEI